ncbi:hypothetical protein ELE36_00110 (plasmid) [Pseudolysobacter antarcticus]|uniref:Uncharacterized protein n=1 Tax=Pseudolysobacter antarcticus TaxID=2511995 RepID=A0A411HEJ2_9GAMM|nr:hypothetical protein [Pseudolysobacter antarcticus]QBB68905.1 hypothetical protein ELE36_00110 [Pseudolysobacter antarcticus]
MKIFSTPSTFGRQPSAYLLGLLCLAAPVTAICAEVAHKLTCILFDTASSELTMPMIALWGVVAFFAVMAAYHGAIAHRCSAILYHRWLR